MVDCEKCRTKLEPCVFAENTWWCEFCGLYWVGMDKEEYKIQVEKSLVEAIREISGSTIELMDEIREGL